MNSAIEISNFYYENLFENFCISINKNSFISFSGPNNCGKTTLIRILNREIIVDSNIEINGERINSYLIEKYETLVGCIIPFEKIPKERTIEQEMYFYNDNSLEIEEILKGLRINTIKQKEIQDLSKKQFILYQLAVELSKSPKIILIDTISPYFEQKEMINIIKFLKQYQEKKEITILYITQNLEETLYTDYLYIMDNKKISLKGVPIEVLEKDNKINKIGLNLPFMMDLSVKLKDYNLLNEIELDKSKMVEELWK